MRILILCAFLITGCADKPKVNEQPVKYRLGNKVVVINDFYEGCTGVITSFEMITIETGDIVPKYTINDVVCISYPEYEFYNLKVIQDKLQLLTIKESK